MYDVDNPIFLLYYIIIIILLIMEHQLNPILSMA